jgi:colicin import membrane protein
MATFVYETPNEKAVSGALALVMHAMFGMLLVFGVTWKKPEPAAMVADLWSNLPPVPAPKAAPVPPPPPPPKVDPEPKPVPKIEPTPVPKVEPKPQPKADIDLREKKEKARLAQEKALLEKKKREEQALAEKKRQEQLAREAQAKRLAAEREQADAQRKLAQQQAAAQAAAQDKLKNEYIAKIRAHIRSRIIPPLNLEGNPETEMEIKILPGGEVMGINTRKRSGQTAWDNAVERAIQRAQPLPVPPPGSPLLAEFRELNLKFRPKE